MNQLRNIVTLLIVFTRLMIPAALCADVVITDVKGTRVELSNVSVDYTRYPSTPSFYTPDHEYSGLRVSHGAGTVLVEWNGIGKVTIQGKREGSGLAAELILGTGTKTVVRTVELKLDSREGLSGISPFGWFWIRLEEVKTIEPLPKRGSPKPKRQPHDVFATVTDVKGDTIRLKNPDGPLYLSLGQGVVELYLGDLARVDITMGPQRDANAVVQFARKGGQQLVGHVTIPPKDRFRGELSADVELGTFTIRWEEISSIVVELKPLKQRR